MAEPTRTIVLTSRSRRFSLVMALSGALVVVISALVVVRIRQSDARGQARRLATAALIEMADVNSEVRAGLAQVSENGADEVVGAVGRGMDRLAAARVPTTNRRLGRGAAAVADAVAAEQRLLAALDTLFGTPPADLDDAKLDAPGRAWLEAERSLADVRRRLGVSFRSGGRLGPALTDLRAQLSSRVQEARTARERATTELPSVQLAHDRVQDVLARYRQVTSDLERRNLVFLFVTTIPERDAARQAFESTATARVALGAEMSSINPPNRLRSVVARLAASITRMAAIEGAAVLSPSQAYAACASAPASACGVNIISTPAYQDYLREAADEAKEFDTAVTAFRVAYESAVRGAYG